MFHIPFARAHVSQRALEQVSLACSEGLLTGAGTYSVRCEAALQALTGAPRAMLTPSGTAALELAALTLRLGPGDEVVMPSFTFPSTANAVALRGAVPVFCEVRADTLNAGVEEVAACLTPRTRAVAVVHYAGNPADMGPILALCRTRGVRVIEDAAQALGSSLHGVAAGRHGDFGAISFHGSKNIGCGEAGALLLNRAEDIAAAEVHLEKGTDRSRFLRHEVDKYAWQDLGSSWVVSELVAAYLDAQLMDLVPVTAARKLVWNAYHDRLAAAEKAGLLRRPALTPGAVSNGHLYHVILPDVAITQRVSVQLRQQGIEVCRHYVPLHGSPAGQRYGRPGTDLAQTADLAERLLRLPLWPGMPPHLIAEVAERLSEALRLA